MWVEIVLCGWWQLCWVKGKGKKVGYDTIWTGWCWCLITCSGCPFNVLFYSCSSCRGRIMCLMVLPNTNCLLTQHHWDTTMKNCSLLTFLTRLTKSELISIPDMFCQKKKLLSQLWLRTNMFDCQILFLNDQPNTCFIYDPKLKRYQKWHWECNSLFKVTTYVGSMFVIAICIFILLCADTIFRVLIDWFLWLQLSPVALCLYFLSFSSLSWSVRLPVSLLLFLSLSISQVLLLSDILSMAHQGHWIQWPSKMLCSEGRFALHVFIIQVWSNVICPRLHLHYIVFV